MYGIVRMDGIQQETQADQRSCILSILNIPCILSNSLVLQSKRGLIIWLTQPCARSCASTQAANRPILLQP